jgi:hypothetical protein
MTNGKGKEPLWRRRIVLRLFYLRKKSFSSIEAAITSGMKKNEEENNIIE